MFDRLTNLATPVLL